MKKSILPLFLLIILSSCKREYMDITSESSIIPSYECANNPAKNLIDKDSFTIWNSCGSGAQWINFHFDKVVDVKSVDLTINTSRNCNISYNVLVKEEGSIDYKNLDSKNISIVNGQLVHSEFNAEKISDVRLTIQNDSSWVCVQHVKIIGR